MGGACGVGIRDGCADAPRVVTHAGWCCAHCGRGCRALREALRAFRQGCPALRKALLAPGQRCFAFAKTLRAIVDKVVRHRGRRCCHCGWSVPHAEGTARSCGRGHPSSRTRSSGIVEDVAAVADEVVPRCGRRCGHSGRGCPALWKVLCAVADKVGRHRGRRCGRCG